MHGTERLGRTMYEELVKLLKDKAVRFDYDGWVDTAAVMEKAAAAIEELSKQVELEHQSGFADGQIAANRRKPHWIPVAEWLPEKRKWVLCRCEADIIEVLRWENNEWYHDPMHVYYPSFVTHWMPLPSTDGLPQPPKEEVSDV